MEKKTIFPFSALDEQQLCHKKRRCLGTWGLEIPKDSLISAADSYLAFTFLALYCCYILELPLNTWRRWWKAGGPLL